MTVAFPQGLPQLPTLPTLAIKDLNTIAWNASLDPFNDRNGIIKTDGTLGTPLHTTPDGTVNGMPLSTVSQYLQSMANAATSSFGSAGSLLSSNSPTGGKK